MTQLKALKSVLSLKNRYGSDFLKGIRIAALNVLSYKLGLKKPWGGMLYFGWDITNRCNARCSYCDRWKRDDHDEITTEHALKVIDDLRKIGVWNVTFGGGEPLLREDLFEIIAYARRSGINVNVNTNGALLRPLAQEIVSSGVNAITISVESHVPSEHESIKKLTGLFEMLTSGIEELKKYGNRPSIKIRFDVNRQNYGSMPAYVAAWREKVDDIIFQPLHDTPSNGFIPSEDLKINEKDMQAFIVKFADLQSTYKEFSNAYYDEFMNFFFHPERIRAYTCFAGSFTFHVDPHQNVYPCTAYVNKLGNLKENSIREIWNGQRTVAWREIARTRANDCSCWFNCNGQINCYLAKLFNM